MIYLTKGQKLFNNAGMVVCDATGYYEDDSTVVCAMVYAPEEPVCRFEAKYVAYGDQVYTISDPDKLMEEVTKIDPNSLLGKTNEEVNVDKLVEQIQTVDNPTPELTPESVINQDNIPDINTNTSTTTSETITTPDTTNPNATSTDNTTTTPTDTTDSPVIDTPASLDTITPEATTTDQTVSMLARKSKKKLS